MRLYWHLLPGLFAALAAPALDLMLMPRREVVPYGPVRRAVDRTVPRPRLSRGDLTVIQGGKVA